jgi:hypothetical protein
MQDFLAPSDGLQRPDISSFRSSLIGDILLFLSKVFKLVIRKKDFFIEA